MAPSRPSPVLAGTLAMVLSGCSGTPFGDALSRSFSRPDAQPTAPATQPTAPATSPQTPAAPETPVRPPAVSPAPKSPAAPPESAGNGSPATRPAAATKPAPYRVTIRLPEGDPSAPAEVLTRALRAAGVPFEVETIERLPAAGAPTPEPAAPASGSSAPAPSRPAPPPR